MLQRLKRAYNRYTALKDIEKVCKLYNINIDDTMMDTHLNSPYMPHLAVSYEEHLFETIYLRKGRSPERTHLIVRYLAKCGNLDNKKITMVHSTMSVKEIEKRLRFLGFNTEWNLKKTVANEKF